MNHLLHRLNPVIIVVSSQVQKHLQLLVHLHQPFPWDVEEREQHPCLDLRVQDGEALSNLSM
jgi:hypothetical protein